MTAPGSARPDTDHNLRVVPITTRLSWGAIFAGLLVATALQLVFAVFGSAIGLAAWDTDSGRALGIGAAIWAVLSLLIALYIGGGTTGRLAGVLTKKDGILHGILVWATSLLFAVWMISSGVSALAGATFSVFGNVAGAAAGAVTSAVGAAAGQSGGIDLQNLRAEVEQLLRQTGAPALNPDSISAAAERAGQTATQTRASNEDVANEIAEMVRTRAGAVDREAMINVIVARTDRSRAEAERIVDRVVSLQQAASSQIDTIQARVGETAEDVASTTSSALWIALLGIGLSLGAAVAGAAAHARE
jgi:hypothetical protein